MLILTRRQGEEIQIGSDISIKICRIKGSHVRIGVKAPSGTKILREEIKDISEKDDQNHLSCDS